MSSSREKQHPEWMDKLFPIAFTIAGLALSAFGWMNLSKGFSSKGWKTTEGVVVESRLLKKGRSSSKTSKGRNYEPMVVYTYTVDGESFTSDRILFGMSSFSTPFGSGKRRANDWVSKYPKETKVTVAFNSTDPAKSTLNTGVHFSAWIAPAMGTLFLLFGLRMFRSFKNQRKNG